jgi:hypothetical protein
MTYLATARARLAEAEADLAAGINPYAAKNVETHRARVARLEAAVRAPTPAASKSPTPAPAAPAPKPAIPAPAITGTREERLRRIAVAFDTDERTLEAAIDDGTTPDEFAVIASDEALVKAKAREILDAAA